MDLSRLVQFPIEIKLCYDGKDLTARIEDYENRVQLIGMNGRQAVKYVIPFVEYKAFSDMGVRLKFEERIKTPYEVDVCRNGSKPVRISDSPVADYLVCRQSSTGNIAWCCELEISEPKEKTSEQSKISELPKTFEPSS